MRPVYVITAAFGADEVMENGQEAYVPIVVNSGAKGIEVRRELLSAIHMSLSELGEVIERQQLHAAYSAAVTIWNEAGELNHDVISAVLDEASAIKASFVKVCLGGYNPSVSDLKELKRLVDEYATSRGIQIALENDQSEGGGTIPPLRNFLQDASRAEIALKMTFDLGNWLWTGENIVEAAKVFAPQTVYIHAKYGVLASGTWKVTAPPIEENTDWQEAMKYFHREIPVAIEFPIFSKEKEKETAQWVTFLAAL